MCLLLLSGAMQVAYTPKTMSFFCHGCACLVGYRTVCPTLVYKSGPRTGLVREWGSGTGRGGGTAGAATRPAGSRWIAVDPAAMLTAAPGTTTSHTGIIIATYSLTWSAEHLFYHTFHVIFVLALSPL